MKILFLINGDAEGADGLRALTLAKYLPSAWTVAFAFRGGKVQSVFSFLRRALAEQPDVIVVVKMAYSGVLAGIAAKILCGCSLVCDTGDAAYALANSTGRYSKTQLMAVWVIEKLGSYLSDYVVTRGSYHKELLEEQWGISRVAVIPDGVELDVDRPCDGTEVRKAFGLESMFVVGLIGSMEWSATHEMCYGWDLVESLQYLRDLPVAVLLIGDGSGRARLERRAADLGVAARVHFLGAKPYIELGKYLGAMQACTSTQSADLVGMVRTTGKLPLYLAHDKYVIATAVGEARRVLPGIGKLLPYVGVKDPKYPQRLAEAIRELVNHPAEAELGGAGRRVAATEFAYSILGKRLQAVIESL